MKIMMKMLSAVAFLLMIISCVTTTPINLPEKYNLDNDLKPVSRISALRISNWDKVDDQSVMFTANGGKYYLLVLNRPLEEMDSKIGIMGNSTSIIAGIDKIYIGSSSNKRFYNIEKIYELDGMDQVKEIKERLNKN